MRFNARIVFHECRQRAFFSLYRFLEHLYRDVRIQRETPSIWICFASFSKALKRDLWSHRQVKGHTQQFTHKAPSLLFLLRPSYTNETFLFFKNCTLLRENALPFPNFSIENYNIRRGNWFLTFFIDFIAEIQGKISGKLILLDEPGLVLHPKGQKDLVDLIQDIAQTNQVVYATPSPFLIPKGETSKLRIVERSDGDTEIRKTGKKDLRKDELIRSVLGMDLLDSYLVSDRTIVVEGATDKKLLYTINEKMIEEQHKVPEKDELKPFKMSKVAIIDSGGASKSPHIAKFLENNGLNYVLLLDYDKQGKQIMKELKKWATSRGMEKHEVNKNLLPMNQIKSKALTIEDLLPKELFLDKMNVLLKEKNCPSIMELHGKGGWVSEINEKCGQKNLSFRLEKTNKFELIRKITDEISQDTLINERGEIKPDYKHLLKLVNQINECFEKQNVEKRSIKTNP